MSEYKLVQEIIARSESNSWDSAKLEWSLSEVYEVDEPEKCLCGHFPIIELCVLQNSYNLGFATVGNCCVKKFLGLDSDKIFQAVKRVRKDDRRALNAETIEYGFDKGWINGWEKDFYLDTMRKYKLSEKQMAKRIHINKKFSNKIKRLKGVGQ